MDKLFALISRDYFCTISDSDGVINFILISIWPWDKTTDVFKTLQDECRKKEKRGNSVYISSVERL